MVTAQKELAFEKELIEKLTTGQVVSLAEAEERMAKGLPAKTMLWEYRDDIKTEEQLWANFKEILERNNQDKLYGKPLSDSEFLEVKKAITGLATPYQAGQFLYGTNGVSQVVIENMDDGRKNVYLTVFDQKQIGGGNTVYQVVNQVRRKPVIPGHQERIFDTTLLINGLPIIQIEEKSEANGVQQALEQMHEYMRERLYTGIFSTLQMLVAMTPHAIRYMANTTDEAFNTDFAFQWQRNGIQDGSHNNNISDWRTFTDSMLSIPMAHKMSTNFMILDGTPGKQKLIAMRPYQVYATQAVLDSIRKKGFGNGTKHGGYIWHTTGSGKTITSFKTAWLAKGMPEVDKVVFVVDRKALTNQTLEKYRAYSPESNGGNTQQVLETNNTKELRDRLKAPGNDIIVTSSQKLMKLVKKKGYVPPDKNILFIVDEAHRSTKGESFERIQKTFPKALFVGYTGTPAFENDSAGKTTKDIFGDLLHAYTIRQAIADRNVLGFNVNFKTTMDHEVLKKRLSDYYKKKHPDWSEQRILEETEKEFPEGLDDDADSSFYDENPEHISIVVEDIFKNWENRSLNGKYNAILTTHVHGQEASTPMAGMYYAEFQRVNKERKEKGLPTLKVGLTYTWNQSNNKSMYLSNKYLDDAVNDYNEMFGTNFGIDTLDSYTEDLMSRLNKTATDGNYLDLVIVVDRLLTGFDAPELNTLYVDRTLKGPLLVQAYSRTNRIHDMNTKSWGRIINYRYPRLNEKMMDEALTLYSNIESAGGDGDTPPKPIDGGGDTPPEPIPPTPPAVLVPPFEEVLEEAKTLREKLDQMTEGFDHIPMSESKREEMLEVLTNFNHSVAKLKQYDYEVDEDGNTIGFDPKNPDELVEKIGMTPDLFNKLTVALKKELVQAVADDRHVPPEQIMLQMVSIKETRVNYDYLTELLNRLIYLVQQKRMEEAARAREEVEEYTKTLSDGELADRVVRSSHIIMKGALNHVKVPDYSGTEAILNAIPTSESENTESHDGEYPKTESSEHESNSEETDVVSAAKGTPDKVTKEPEADEDDTQMPLLSVDEILRIAGEAADNEAIQVFREIWGLTDVISNAEIAILIYRHEPGNAASWEKTEIKKIAEKNIQNYQHNASPEVQKLSKIKYRNGLRNAYFELADLIRKFS